VDTDQLPGRRNSCHVGWITIRPIVDHPQDGGPSWTHMPRRAIRSRRSSSSHDDEAPIANALPASAATLPASKAEIKDAVRTLLDALVITHQLTAELTAFLEDAFVALAR
jgi:hypothetical protein